MQCECFSAKVTSCTKYGANKTSRVMRIWKAGNPWAWLYKNLPSLFLLELLVCHVHVFLLGGRADINHVLKDPTRALHVACCFCCPNFFPDLQSNNIHAHYTHITIYLHCTTTCTLWRVDLTIIPTQQFQGRFWRIGDIHHAIAM